MADKIFSVNAGFFDSVNQDRLYSADQMNRPYKRIVANGVFATPQGTPSTDLQVSGSGTMTITVAAGEGIFADKWFENPNPLTIVVPNNTGVTPRIDSVIAQVDLRTSGRVGSIVYRTGTASTNPELPPINTISGVVEYRIANVFVAPSANAINNDSIADLRGSESCPWVTSLIQQVDTSTLFEQWQTAYQNYYDESTAEFEEYEAQRAAEWKQFFDNLTQDLTLSTNVITLRSSYTTAASSVSIPVDIASYNPTTDILAVFINGLLADESKYTYVASGNRITLANPLDAGQTVSFVVFKSVITGDISTVQTLIQQLENRISQLAVDSGWQTLSLERGSAYNSENTPGVRRVGDRIYIRGAIKGVTTLGSVICTLPVAYRPAMNHIFTSVALSGTTVHDTVVIQVLTTGSIKLMASSGSLSSSDMISIATNFPLN